MNEKMDFFSTRITTQTKREFKSLIALHGYKTQEVMEDLMNKWIEKKKNGGNFMDNKEEIFILKNKWETLGNRIEEMHYNDDLMKEHGLDKNTVSYFMDKYNVINDFFADKIEKN